MKLKRSKIEVFPAADGWRWHVCSANGEIVGQSEGYQTKQAALKGVSALRRAMFFPQLKVTP